jgi:serine/threonine protein kinase
LLQPNANEVDLKRFIGEYLNESSEEVESASSNSRLNSMTPMLEQGFGCLTAGLAFMHEKKIRHKDIKLRNISVHGVVFLYTDSGYAFDSKYN